MVKTLLVVFSSGLGFGVQKHSGMSLHEKVMYWLRLKLEAERPVLSVLTREVRLILDQHIELLASLKRRNVSVLMKAG